MLDAYALGKPYIFGGSTEAGTVKLQKRIMPRDFHQGTATVGDQETSYWIYYVGRLESILTMLRFVAVEYFRAKFKTRTRRRRPSSAQTDKVAWLPKLTQVIRNLGL